MITIEVPRIHPSINVWRNWHWAKRMREKDQWASDIGWLLKPFKSDKIGGKAKIMIWYCFTDNSRRDKDNYTPKFILDPIVKSGIISDDNSKNLDCDWDFKFDSDKPKTIIEISEVINAND